MSTLLARLFRRTVKADNGCWEWCGSRKSSGYGQIAINRYPYSTHRVSYALHKGPIPKGLNVLHTCDNPPCINPAHLFLGTHEDNVRDCIAKGRRGTPPKLSKEQIEEIQVQRQANISRRVLAEIYEVSYQTIRNAELTQLED